MNLQVRAPSELGNRARAVLQSLSDHEHEDGGELVMEGLAVWFGLETTSVAIVKKLLECCFIRQEYEHAGYRLFTINESGKRFLKGLPPYRDSEGKWHESLFTMLRK